MSPYGLDADGIDTLIQIVEDNGVSVVGDVMGDLPSNKWSMKNTAG